MQRGAIGNYFFKQFIEELVPVLPSDVVMMVGFLIIRLLPFTIWLAPSILVTDENELIRQANGHQCSNG
jgi:hypothetical protein